MAESIIYSSSIGSNGDSWEVGDIRQTLRTDLGDDWLLCNGENVDENEYPDLYSKLFNITPIQSYGTSVSLANNSSDKAYLATEGIIYANGNFVIYGRNVDGNGHNVIYSPDPTLSGDLWSVADNSDCQFYRLWFTNNRFIGLISGSDSVPTLRVFSDSNFSSYTDYSLPTKDWGRAGIGIVNGYPIEALTYFNGYYYCGYNESTSTSYPGTISSGIMRTTNFSSWEKKQLISISYAGFYSYYPSNSGLTSMAVNPETGDFCATLFKGIRDGYGEFDDDNQESCDELICKDNFNNFSNLTTKHVSTWSRVNRASLSKLVTYNKSINNFFSTLLNNDPELYPLSSDNSWYSDKYTLLSSPDFDIVSLGSDNYNDYVYIAKESEETDYIDLIELDCGNNAIIEQHKLFSMPKDGSYYMYQSDIASFASSDKYLVFNYWRINNTTDVRENIIIWFDKEAKSIPELSSNSTYYYIKAKG